MNYPFVLLYIDKNKQVNMFIRERYSEIVDKIKEEKLRRKDYKIFFAESLSEVTQYYYDLVY